MVEPILIADHDLYDLSKAGLDAYLGELVVLAITAWPWATAFELMRFEYAAHFKLTPEPRTAPPGWTPALALPDARASAMQALQQLLAWK